MKTVSFIAPTLLSIRSSQSRIRQWWSVLKNLPSSLAETIIFFFIHLWRSGEKRNFAADKRKKKRSFGFEPEAIIHV